MDRFSLQQTVTEDRFFLPLLLASSISASRFLRAARCFSSSSCLSLFASSHRPSSMARWSGRSRLSVGATPSSGSFSVIASDVKLYILSEPGLQTQRQGEGERVNTPLKQKIKIYWGYKLLLGAVHDLLILLKQTKLKINWGYEFLLGPVQAFLTVKPLK